MPALHLLHSLHLSPRKGFVVGLQTPRMRSMERGRARIKVMVVYVGEGSEVNDKLKSSLILMHAIVYIVLC